MFLAKQGKDVNKSQKLLKNKENILCVEFVE